MQANEILKYINAPELVDRESIPHLEKLVNDFPYFHSGHILLSLASKKYNTSVYQQSIKKTAIVVSNRSHLYNLLNQEKEPEIATVLDKKEFEAETIVETVEVKTEPVNVIEKTETPLIEPKKAISGEEIVEQEIEKAVVNSFVEKEILKTNEITKNEVKDKPASFGDWLQFVKKNNGESYEEIEQKVKDEKLKTFEKKQEKDISKTKQKQKALIDKIIESNPGPIRQKEEQKFFKSDQKAKESLLESEHLITETLAQIYAFQGNINKAIRAYEILSLKFPQKSVYFASLIQKLKSNQ